MTLTPVDWLLILVYFLFMLGIGLGMRRRAGRDLQQYFLSGRSLPWWIAGTSMVATTFAADTPLAVSGLVTRNGLAGNWFWWAFAMGGMLTVFVYARLWRRAEVLTDVELIEIRYGGRPAAVLRGVRAGYLALIVNPIIMGWVIRAMVKVLKGTVLSDVQHPYADWWILLGCLAVVGVYGSLSGLWGVVLTDAVQFVLALAGCIALAIVAVRRLGGVASMREQVVDKYGPQAFDYLPDVTASDPWLPLHVFLIMLLVQWWATWYPGAEPGGGGFVVQRMASCKNERHAMLATLWYQVAHYCLRPWPWLLVAFAALAVYSRESLAEQPDMGFVWIMRDYSPPGLRGLMLVTFFAAFMSTLSTQMNWGASYLANDVYARFIRPQAGDRELTSFSRAASIVSLSLGGLSGFLMVHFDLSVDDAWKLLVALGAGTGAVFMLRWFWWRINAWTEIAAMIASLLFFCLFSFRVVDLGDVADEVVTLAVALSTIVCWLLITWITPPESERVLDAFYRKVHPGGPGWKPVARRQPDVAADRDLGRSILAALLASGLIYLVLPGVGLLIFGRPWAGAACLAVGAVCGGGAVWLDRQGPQSAKDG